MVVDRGLNDDKFNSYKGVISLGADTSLQQWGKKVTKQTCSSCGKQKSQEEFPIIPLPLFGFEDKMGKYRWNVCNQCIEPMMQNIMSNYPDIDKYHALYCICAKSGVYYSDYIARKIFNEDLFYPDDTRAADGITRAEYYFRYIALHEPYKHKSFYDSENVCWEPMLMAQGTTNDEDLMSEATKKTRATIISTYHRDPFENESREDRVQMYEDLLTMTTADVGENLPKSRALIEIRTQINCFTNIT